MVIANWMSATNQAPPSLRWWGIVRVIYVVQAAGTGVVNKPGLSQIFLINELLTIGDEIAAHNVVERKNDSECHCREAEAPVEG